MRAFRENPTVFAGMLMAVAMTDAAGTLVALPRIVLVITGVVCAGLALAQPSAGRKPELRSGPTFRRWPAATVPLLAGALIGLTLPHAAPAPGMVVTGLPGIAVRGDPARGDPARGDLFSVLERLDERPNDVLGRRVSVSGDWTPAADGRLATVSRRVMQCCAADAIAVGLDVEPARTARLPQDAAQVRVTGVVRAAMRAGELRYVITDASVRP